VRSMIGLAPYLTNEMQDQIGNFRYTTETAYFPSWKKGEQKRLAILKLLQENPEISMQDLAIAIELSPAQVKRHRAKLISECLWKVCGFALLISSTFVSGAYWADSEAVENYCIDLFNLAIEKTEKAFWTIEQKTL